MSLNSSLGISGNTFECRQQPLIICPCPRRHPVPAGNDRIELSHVATPPLLCRRRGVECPTPQPPLLLTAAKARMHRREDRTAGAPLGTGRPATTPRSACRVLGGRRRRSLANSGLHNKHGKQLQGRPSISVKVYKRLLLLLLLPAVVAHPIHRGRRHCTAHAVVYLRHCAPETP